QHPVFGVGLGAFLLDRETAGLQAVVVHSVPVWFLAEMGLAGFAAYAFFITSLLLCGASALRRKDWRAPGLLIAVTAFVLMGLVPALFCQRAFWFASGLMVRRVGGVAARRLPETG